MVDQVFGDLFDSRFRAHELGQFGPTALGLLASRDILLVFDDLLDLFVERVDLRAVDVELGEAALVVDRYGGPVVHRLLDVIDADVVAEDPAGIPVLA